MPEGECVAPFKLKSHNEIDLPPRALLLETTLKEKSKRFKVYFRASLKRKTCFMDMP